MPIPKMRPFVPLLLPAVAGLLLAGCAGGAVESGETPEPASETAVGPFVRVLGTAQDGGFPHAACGCDRCETARREPHLRRGVASLAVVLPASRRVFLVDATPDLREQLDLLADVRDVPAGRVDRAPVDGVLLTHAHMGHYLGLAFFGFEAVHTRGLPVFGTPRMAAFLRSNAPWDQLVRLGNVEPVEVAPGEGFELGDGVRATALAVPHRAEYTDTVAYLLSGSRHRVLYVPDTDSWRAWEPSLPEVLARHRVDVALLDGTFFSPDELPGRAVADIGHPLITETLELLGAAVAAGDLAVYFTHLNHSNPALEPDGPAARRIAERGFAVLADGQEIPL